MLAQKLEAFDNIRRSLPRGTRRHVKASETVNDGRKGRICADTGSSHSIAGERMFQIFKDKGLLFQETTLAVIFAEGQQTTSDALTTQNCPGCIKYKSSNPKTSGLLQTPVSAQSFETLAIDLFGPLPESKDGKRWILFIEDCTIKWVELFTLLNATAKECAINLIEEVLLRHGIPRHLINDNGTQFVSAVMQQICYLLNIHQSLIHVYHSQANPVERKYRDLKPRLTILVQDKHDCWSEKLPFIRFALSTAKCETTGQKAALNFW
ncbi:transposon Tf2-8 polyprotein [Trichonephila clavipes]|nr:transposon Tf2-8 polyprotein [Trichonephila clavipes]